ncbi:hypothetical protein FBUS_09039 [Fasciolopsis buskii]|uniref:Uncharacterized protein n=1 Tax=Fasciolopsis buskii TaxID=27845 RepID=A0A8E0RLS6_9TREM|nr:hypothetical protein FBUS_09039 [Fasciolopsis buski]
MLSDLIRSSDLFTDFNDSAKRTRIESVPTLDSLNWSEVDDRRLLELVSRLGENRWNLIGKKLCRPSYQCQERYFSYLRPQFRPHTEETMEAGILQGKEIHSDRLWIETGRSDITNHSVYGHCRERISKELPEDFYTRDLAKVQHQSLNHRLGISPLRDQENHPFRRVGLQNSHFSQVNGAKRKPVFPEVPDNQQSNRSKQKCLVSPNFDSHTVDVIPKTNTTVCKPEPLTGDQYDEPLGSYTSMPLLSQLSLKQQSSRDRLTINLPCVPGSSPLLTSRPVLSREDSFSSVIRKHRPTYKLKFTTPWSQRLVLQSSPLGRISPPKNTNEPAWRTKPSFYSHSGPVTGLPAGVIMDDLFSVQTPTKALSEADHLSFHLSSPPAVLRNLVTGNGSARYVGRTQKSEGEQMLVRSSSTRLSSKLVDTKPVCARLFDEPPGCGTATRDCSLICSSNVTTPSTSRSLISSLGSSRPVSDDAKCLALLTAKATVWSKALNPTVGVALRPPISKSIHTNTLERLSLSSSESALLPVIANRPRVFGAASPYKPPSLRLQIPPRQQPQLSSRRVLQVGFENKWRRFAFGTSQAHRLSIRMARQFLNDFKESGSHSDTQRALVNNSPSHCNRLDLLLNVKPEPAEF